MTDTYKVIQADRDAAADLWTLLERHGWQTDYFRTGQSDQTEVVQAFAKHREDTEALIVGWLREQIESIDTGGQSEYDDGLGAAVRKFEELLGPITAGDHHTNNTPTD